MLNANSLTTIQKKIDRHISFFLKKQTKQRHVYKNLTFKYDDIYRLKVKESLKTHKDSMAQR